MLIFTKGEQDFAHAGQPHTCRGALTRMSMDVRQKNVGIATHENVL
jgi:hypothetical protein